MQVRVQCGACQGAGRNQDGVLATFREKRAAHPGKAVLAFNLDRCDVDSDGLTDGEHDALDDVLVADVGIAWDEAKERIAKLLRAAGAR